MNKVLNVLVQLLQISYNNYITVITGNVKFLAQQHVTEVYWGVEV